MAIVDQIVAEAQRQGVDPSIAIEVARAESGLNPNIPDSSAGAIGLFQLEPATAASLGVNPRDVSQNIAGGVAYLRQMLLQFGDVATALAGYNWGPTALSKAIAKWGTPGWFSHAPAETKTYVSKILAALGEYQQVLTPASVAAGVQNAVSTAGQTISDLFSSVSSQSTIPPPTSPTSPASTFFWLGIAVVGLFILAEVTD